MDVLLILIVQIVGIYKWILIFSVVLSWLIAFNVVNTSNRLVYVVSNFLFRVTEPVLRPIRRVIPSMGGVDISPVILFFILWFVQMYILRHLLPYFS